MRLVLHKVINNSSNHILQSPQLVTAFLICTPKAKRISSATAVSARVALIFVQRYCVLWMPLCRLLFPPQLSSLIACCQSIAGYAISVALFIHISNNKIKSNWAWHMQGSDFFLPTTNLNWICVGNAHRYIHRSIKGFIFILLIHIYVLAFTPHKHSNSRWYSYFN